MADRHADDDALPTALVALADGTLWSAALDVDRSGEIPASHFEAIYDLGLFAMTIPAELGGLGFAPPAVRRVLRVLGAGCGATAFAFAQHGGVAAAVARTTNDDLRRAWLPRLIGGELAGTAFAHVRRAGPPAVVASRLDGGWRLDGEAPWATSWGTASVFSVAAVSGDGELVWVLVPGRSAATVVPSGPMELVAFGATRTVSLDFRGHEVADGDVLEVVDFARWLSGDRRGAVRPNPLCVGIGDRALRQLGRVAADRAEDLAGWWSAVASRAEAASRAIDDGVGDVGPVAARRTETVLATQAITTALMAAAGGRATGSDHPAQLLARQALFYVVQAQNDDGRAATLDAIAALGQAGIEAPKN